LAERRVRFCGVDCNSCSTYLAFQAGDTGKLVNPETRYRCCWLPREYPEGRDCPIRLCCEGKGLLLCGECAQFDRCTRMRAFYGQPGYDWLRKRMLELVASKGRPR
jgi:hypothetical protein